MRKIIINDCHGGYGLSNLAIIEYLKLIGKEAFFYKYSFKDESTTYVKIEESEIGIFVPFYVSTVDKGNEFKDENNENDKNVFMIDNISREDPKLIYIVEKLGSKAASGNFAELKIIEIPDDVDWVIQEDGGKEYVAEKHRIWS